MLRSTRSRVAAEMGRFPESTYETVEVETPAALATSSIVATVRLSDRACVRPDGRRQARLGASAPTLALRTGRARDQPRDRQIDSMRKRFDGSIRAATRGFIGSVRGHDETGSSRMSKRFDDPTGGPGEPWRERHGHLLNSAADPRTVVLDGRHRDLLTGTDTTGAVDLGPEGAVALIERTS